MDVRGQNSICRHVLWGGLVLSLLIFGAATLTVAAGNPGFLDENTSDVPAGTKTYRIWYTVDCNGGADCECDSALDLDTSDPADGVPDEDSPNDCIATVDSDADGVFDTGPDDDGDDVLNVVDLDWFGGGAGVVESVPRNVQRSVNRYVNDWGLKNPKWDTDANRNIYVFDIDYLGLAYGNGSGEELDTAWMLTQAPEPRGTVLHELWHNTQYAYGVSAGNWLMEGQARMLQDKVFDDLDNRVGSRYHGSVAAYLGNTTYVNWEDRDDDGVGEFAQADGLLGASYNASLWWTYIADQAGALYAGTAGEGIDALEAVLEQADDHGRQGVSAVSHVLNDRIGQGFDDTFWDFTVANYAKDFDLTQLDHDYLGGRDPERVLKYSDEKRTDPDKLIYGYNDAVLGWVDGPERQTLSGAQLFAGVSGRVDAMDPDVSDPDAMGEYGVNYYEAIVNPDCLLVYWRVIGDPGARFLHSWMMIQDDSNGDGEEEVVSLLRSEGGDFARAAWNLRNPTGGPGATDYTRMVGVVATTGHAYGYDWELGCTQPTVNIVAPTTANPAYVGEPDDPGRFLLWLEVTGAMGTSTYVAGLEWSRDFTVTVDSHVAEILNGGYVQNQYWLVVQAPDIPGASIGDKFDVSVELGPLGTAGDTETDAVIYDLLSSDQVLVVDASGSMGDNNKLVSAKTAARLFADVVQKFDQLGVVSFSADATEEFTLTLVPDQDDAAGVRAHAQAAIDGITEKTSTSVGDGLQMGQDFLDAKGDPDNQWAMVLLSDGMENQPLYWDNVRAGIVAAGTRVHAIALGRDADEELMRDIAESTCGAVWVDQCYHYIEESGVLAAGAHAPAAFSLPNGLADIYRRSQETIADHQRLWQDSGTLDGSQLILVEILDDGVRDAFFSFNWDNPSAPLDVNISGPTASFIKLDDGQNHVVFFADKLDPGTYSVNLSAPSGPSQWIGSLSGRVIHGTTVYAFIDNVQSERFPGLPVRLQASLTDDDGPVTGAVISATVQHPELGTEVVRLVDDGGPFDDIANDGVYGFVYDRINRPLEIKVELGHTWVFDLHATGVNNSGNPFERYERLTYTPFLGREQVPPDSDGDGMISLWEDRFDATDSSVPDGDKDPDGDGLTNKEEFERGTNPDDPDTDRGGEIDGSEELNGQNPLYTADDSIPPITDFWTRNLSQSVVLNFNPLPEYRQIQVYRGLTTSSFSLVGTYDLPTMTTALRNRPTDVVPVFDPAKGQLLDEELVNDQDYFYYLQPVGASGVVGAPSVVRRAEPAADPDQPEGAIVINDDDALTTSKNVTLTLHALTTAAGAQNVTHVQISNSADLTGVGWQPFKQQVAWTLNPDPDTGLAFVYVRFRDGAGNVSDVIYSDGIVYHAPLVFPPGLLDLLWLRLDFRHPWFTGFTFTLTPLNLGDLGLGGTMGALAKSQGGASLYFGGIAFDLEAEDDQGQPVTQFGAPFTLTLTYEDWQWQSAGIGAESSLNLYWNQGGAWEPVLPCAGCSHDRANNVIVAVLDHLTQFALFGEPAAPVYLPLVLR